MKIFNVNIYGLKESIKASAYPFLTEVKEMGDDVQVTPEDIKRAKGLGKAKPGSGHDCYSKGIIVQFDLQVGEYLWRQLDRYHFRDYVSSMSKMHKILDMDLDLVCNEYVTKEAKENMINCMNDYKMNPTSENFERMISNLVSGIQLTARITTNYLQLKTIYHQRKNHKLPTWKKICLWIENLPYFKELILGE